LNARNSSLRSSGIIVRSLFERIGKSVGCGAELPSRSPTGTLSQ
jgi:hypothetical protein